MVHARQYCGVLRSNDFKQAKFLEFQWVSSSSNGLVVGQPRQFRRQRVDAWQLSADHENGNDPVCASEPSVSG
jgi:hypothetical protein